MGYVDEVLPDGYSAGPVKVYMPNGRVFGPYPAPESTQQFIDIRQQVLGN
jgi:hypothetical protein